MPGQYGLINIGKEQKKKKKNNMEKHFISAACLLALRFHDCISPAPATGDYGIPCGVERRDGGGGRR